MPFWLQEPMFAVHTRRLSTPMRLLITLCIFLLLGSGWGIFCWLPLRNAVVQVTCTNRDMQKHLAQQQVVLKNQEAVAVSYFATRQKYEAMICTLQPEQAIDAMLASLKRHEIACKGLEPLAKRTKNFIEKEYVSLKMRAPYRQIVAFLSELDAQQGRAIKCKECRFKRWRDSQVQVHAIMRLARLAVV
ncbi:hypothetical protein IPF37_03000 [bacterium]|nr:MAG: hypothetical protein IPF37_03000 [bacterium]